MSDNNNLPQKKDNAGLALQKTDSHKKLVTIWKSLDLPVFFSCEIDI
jgi:hypothetical protein